jgi:hypothetical protein
MTLPPKFLVDHQRGFMMWGAVRLSHTRSFSSFSSSRCGLVGESHDSALVGEIPALLVSTEYESPNGDQEYGAD